MKEKPRQNALRGRLDGGAGKRHTAAIWQASAIPRQQPQQLYRRDNFPATVVKDGVSWLQGAVGALFSHAPSPVNRDSIVQMRGAVSISSLHRSRTAQRRSNSLSSAAHGLNATAPARAKGLASPCKAYAYWQDTPRKEATREAMSGGMARALG